MSEKTKTTKKTKKKGLSRSGIVLIIGLLIILIPCLVFAGILLKSYVESNKPVIADRFDGDLDPTITQENIDSIKSALSALPQVENVEIEMTTAQLRINIDTVDSISEEEAKQLTNDAYNSVNSVLPVKTYFTATESMKMYDLTINVFNKIGNDDGTMVYYLLTKNSKMSEPGVQLVSKPLDEELAKQLRGETEAESSEVSVNESDLAPEDGGSEE